MMHVLSEPLQVEAGILEPGKLYLVDRWFSPDNLVYIFEYIGHGYNGKDGVEGSKFAYYNVVACLDWGVSIDAHNNCCDADYLKSIKEISLKELPLYISWNCTSIYGELVNG